MSCLYGLSIPYMISAISYNTIQLGCAMLLFLIFIFEINNKLIDIVSGFLLACMVLCNPFSLILYIALCLMWFFNRDYNNYYGSTSRFKRIHVGILILLLPFCLYIYRSITIHQTGLRGFVSVLLGAVSSDGAHDYGGIIGFILQKGNAIHELCFEYFPYSWMLIVLTGVVVTVRRITNTVFLFISLAVTNIFALYAAIHFRNHLVLLFPFILGVFWCLRFPNKAKGKLSILLIVLFIVSAHCASNNGILAIAWASVPGGMISWIALEDLIKNESIHMGMKSYFLLVFSGMLMIGSFAIMDYRYVFWDDDIQNLTQVIERGPLAGVRTTLERKQIYDKIYDAIRDLDANDECKVLFYETCPLDILILNREVCSISTWYQVDGSFRSFFLSKSVQSYYNRNPSKEPNILFVNKSFLKRPLEEDDFEAIKNAGFTLIKANEIAQVYIRK